MEVSDSEDDGPRKKPRKESDSISCLKDENDSLRCQLEAYKNEIDIVRCDLKSELDLKEKQLKLVQQTLQGMQQLTVEFAILENGARTDGAGDESSDTANNESPVQKLSEKDARLIGLISVFLHVHPFGAGVDYIWSFLHKMDSTIKPNEVEVLMSKFPTVFHQQLSGIGAHMERRWSFGGFKNESPKDKV
ncbi:ecto-NOX disulfide-thiol exchanger 2-like [Nilaparvata lugens]|uniref:ecto-NOX disulfide-thiol exchanger 2-like n=1 Tax=Nilaparvata lugens TaxID=108931 RepID=UPI00193EBF50|nr:ecto-NOX disulfide-thiol exchanger 2-like [Nilaparvata lugens]